MVTSDPLTVFMIDDSELDIGLAEQGLEDFGIEVVSSTSVFGVHVMLKRVRPQMVLLDVTMPAMAGPVLCRFLKKATYGGMPILLHSHLPEDELSLLAEECGADGYLRKTADFVSLAAAVRDCVSRDSVGGLVVR